METFETVDPLPITEKKPFITVGLTYNLKKGIKSEIEDIEAEYDSMETVLAIRDAIERLNCRVELFEADNNIFQKLQSTKIDIVFNIAEGIAGRGREAQIPAILNYLKIPFTGSDETTLCLSLDKALTKRLLATYKIKTPKYQLFYSENTKLDSKMKFPLIVKPNAEGSSKGIWDFAIVWSISELKQLVDKNFKMYNQTMLVEEFISGREFTVGVAGNGNETVVFPPMEICYKNRDRKDNIYSYNVKKNYKEYIEYICPPILDKDIQNKMTAAACKIFMVLECRDFSRIDFRMSEEGEIYFIEINPLPGLAPGYSDYPMIAQFNNIEYDTIIKVILNSALKRYGMKPVV